MALREILAELIKQGRKEWEGGTNNLDGMIANHLVANGVAMPVPCKECVYFKNAEWYRSEGKCTHPSHMRSQVPYYVPQKHFCAYGKRRNNV